jgi:hypothetical protein
MVVAWTVALDLTFNLANKYIEAKMYQMFLDVDDRIIEKLHISFLFLKLTEIIRCICLYVTNNSVSNL